MVDPAYVVIIAALITGLCAIIAEIVGPVIASMLKNREKKMPTDKEESPIDEKSAIAPPPLPKIKSKKLIKIVIVVLVIIAIYSVGLLPHFGGFTSTPTQAEVSITYPLNSATVQMKETIAGTAKNIPDNQQLWIVIYPQDAYKYYPQNPVNVQSDGSWSLPVQFGEAQNVGKYDLYAVLADNNAQKQLSDYITKSENAKSWDGMRILPSGTIEFIKITVTRA